MMLVFSIILLVIPRYVCSLFTFQPDIIDQFKSGIIVITVLFVCDASMGTMAGVIKGISMQSISSVSNIICYTLISIPAMYMFCFSLDLGLFGIFLGYDIGSIANLAFNCYLIVFKEWKMMDFKDMIAEEEEDESLYYNIESRKEEESTSSESMQKRY